MKKHLLTLLLAVSLVGVVNAQDSTSNKQFMQITSIESVYSGGFGRSKLITTNPDGTQEEEDLENLFSLTGLNFKNIKSNELKITQTIKKCTDKG